MAKKPSGTTRRPGRPQAGRRANPRAGKPAPNPAQPDVAKPAAAQPTGSPPAATPPAMASDKPAATPPKAPAKAEVPAAASVPTPPPETQQPATPPKPPMAAPPASRSAAPQPATSAKVPPVAPPKASAEPQPAAEAPRPQQLAASAEGRVSQPTAEPTSPQPAKAPPGTTVAELAASGVPVEPEPVPQTQPPVFEPETEPAPEPAAQPEPEPVVYHEPSPAPEHHRPSLYIVQITPEMAPIAKVGGLADVVFGLSRELAIRGNHVEIILPKYDNLRYDHIFEMHEVYKDLWVPWYGGAIHCTVFFGYVHDRKCFFIEPHSKDNFFNRGAVYGFKDDILRFAFFSRAAVEFLWKAGKHPDIIHCHDWQTALVPVLLFEMFQRLGMGHPRVCLTIHNFAHQGITGTDVLAATGLNQPERFLDYHRLRDNRYVNALNLLKGGVVYSNFVTTVSPRYAYETKDQGQGFGLEPTLHTHHMKYGGVVNGIDYDVWNPEIDHLLPERYGAETIDGKYGNKRALRQRLMLADNDKPIVAFIGRLDPQKGLDLLRHAIFYSLERGAQFVLLGSSPDPRINEDFWGLKHMLNDSPDCHLEIGFDEELSHLIYAGSDIMLVPSRFEPCGLTQLISLRYGTIPVVRSVGGLADTVFDKDHSERPLHERNGYVFQDYDHPGLESALGRAIACYFNHPDHFRELIKNAMRTDYSWNVPGQDYLNIYDYIRNK